MKSTTTAIILLLLPATATAFQISGESGFYTVQLNGKYDRETGLNRWEGRKSGYYYQLKLKEDFHLTRGTTFKLSITTGNTKVPYINLFTSEEDTLFTGSSKTFNVEDLFLEKKGFLLKNLTLKVGKQLFEVPALFKDHLWGGSLTYSTPSFKLFWNQIAGYEGNYLLPRRSSEDDVDITVLEINWRRITAGIYRIMDARGDSPAEFKNGLFLKFKGDYYSISTVSQNGKLGGWGKISLHPLNVKAGYWQNRITTYGYSEELRDEGLIFRPTTDGMRFGKISCNFRYSNIPFTLYTARFETSSGKLIGNEFGGEVEYPLWNGYLFLKGGIGSNSSYALFGGYRWGIKILDNPGRVKVKLKNYFNVIGEYADFPGKNYQTQLEYEGWSKYHHVGYWHSTYKLTAYTQQLRFKVSTGRNSKVDYIVWGNTADNFMYQRTHRKLWHLEELSLSQGKFTLGLQPVSVRPLFSDYLPGLSLSINGMTAGVFYQQMRNGRGRKDYGVAIFSYRNFSYTAVTNGSSTQSALTFYLKKNGLTLGAIKEWGFSHRNDWGAVAGVEGEILKTKISVNCRVFSQNLSTFNLREFYRDSGLALRPGEKGVRYISASAETPLNFLELSRFSTKLLFTYNRLYRFSGGFVAHEFGAGIILKPGKKCSLELLGSAGSPSLRYTGLKFLLNW